MVSHDTILITTTDGNDMKKIKAISVISFLFLIAIAGSTASAASYYSDDNSSNMFLVPFIMISVFVVIFIVYLVIAIWVYKDAKKRKENAALWALIVFITPLVGIILWMIMRPPIGGRKTTPDRMCPNCGRGIPFDAQICPYCAKKFESYL